MIWIFLILLTIAGGATAVGLSLKDRRRALGGGGGNLLEDGAGPDALLERTIFDLRVGDVLTIDGKDFLCEGLVSYDEDGHRWSGARIVDGADVRWLVLGIERAGARAVRLLAADSSVEVSGFPSQVMVIGEVRYTLDKRGTATCKLAGDVGALGQATAAAPGAHVERCRWWLYGAAGDDTMIVEQWGNDHRVLRGKISGEGTIDLITGS
jgi:hypothetical protein